MGLTLRVELGPLHQAPEVQDTVHLYSINNTGISRGPRVLGPVSELWDRSLNSGVGRDGCEWHI